MFMICPLIEQRMVLFKLGEEFRVVNDGVGIIDRLYIIFCPTHNTTTTNDNFISHVKSHALNLSDE